MFPQKTFLTKKYPVTQDFFQQNGLSISQIAKCLEDISTEHAQMLGFGYDQMISRNLLWMISKCKMEFFAPITADVGEIVITTWPTKNRRAFCNRYFVCKDKLGNKLFQAVYVWVVVDANSRTVANTQQVEEIYNGDFDIATLDFSFQKVTFDGDDWAFECVKSAQVDHLDKNNHVNNTHYFSMSTSGEKSFIKTFQLNFQRELLLGESISIYKTSNGLLTQVCGVKADGTISFSACYTVQDN